MKIFLEYILNHLVDHPEDVMIEEVVEEGMTTFYLHVNQEDIGKVIGKRGSVINSIRTLAKVRAIKDHLRVRIQVAEADDRRSGDEQPRHDEQPMMDEQVSNEGEMPEMTPDMLVEQPTE